MIRTENLRRSYGNNVAVDAVGFEIKPGEVVGLLGHNGAGKTTIMKMLTGFLEPDIGLVEVDGVDLAQSPEAVKAQLGYLPEALPVYPEMIVADYLDYVAALRGVDAAERPAAIRRALAETDLTNRALDPIGTLSRGYRQRVGVAGAIIHQPKFLILDEPTNGLDPEQTQHMRDLILRLSSGATVILSTHIMQEVDAICSRVMILGAGRLALDESLADIKHSNRVLLDTSADEAAVQAALGGSVQLERSGDGFSLQFAGALGDDVGALTAELAKTLVEHGIDIRALYPEKRDLETVFREVSATQDSASQDSASQKEVNHAA